MPTSPPRTIASRYRRARDLAASKRTLPEIDTLGVAHEPSIEYIATLLPDPDSPTMPSTSFVPTSKESPSTARTTPWRVANETDRSRTLKTASVGVSSGDNANPWIDVGVDHVDGGAREDHEERAVHDTTHDERQVEVLQSLVGEPSDSLKAEDDLGQQRGTAHEYADVEAEEVRRSRSASIAVRGDRGSGAREAFGSGGANVVLVHIVDQFAAQHSGVDSRVETRQREPGKKRCSAHCTGSALTTRSRIGHPRKDRIMQPALGDERDHLTSQYTGMEIAAMPKNMTNGSTNLPLFLAAMTRRRFPRGARSRRRRR